MLRRLSISILFLFTISVQAYTPISSVEQQQLLAEFDYKPQIKISKESTTKLTKHCVQTELEYDAQYPQSQKPLQITGRLYTPKKRRNRAQYPIVILLPPMGGMNLLDKSMAKTFCKKGIAAIILRNDFSGLEKHKLIPLSDQDQGYFKAVAGIKATLEYAKTRQDIDVDKAGLFGVSLGGILGSVAYGVMEELYAATFIVNGGDVPYILANSRQRKVVRQRKNHMKQLGLTDPQDFEDIIRQNMTIDPLHFANLIPTESVRLILSKKDKNVPSIKQEQFYEALGRPETTFHNSGHTFTVIRSLFLGSSRSKIANWYLERFSQPNNRRIPRHYSWSPANLFGFNY